METHRLKPMKPGYSEKLFNKLYKEVQPLKYRLVSQIDCRRLGVTKDIVESWFDDKIIYVFNKYCEEKEPDALKGFILNSLSTFKYRILRKAYQADIHENLVELEGEKELINIIPDESEINEAELFLELAHAFMQKALTENALLIYELQLNPPPFILKRLKNPNSRIPTSVLAEFLSLGNSRDSLEYVNELREEINMAIKQARTYFKESGCCLEV